MPIITLISGSTLGNAEYVAEHLAEIAAQQGFSTMLCHGANLDQLPLEGIWLLICSTHGAGELPDNLSPLRNQIEQGQPDLSKIQFGAIGLGSRDYDQFCNAIKTLDKILQKQGAIRVGDRLEIDALSTDLPETIAEQWLNEWLKLLK